MAQDERNGVVLQRRLRRLLAGQPVSARRIAELRRAAERVYGRRVAKVAISTSGPLSRLAATSLKLQGQFLTPEAQRAAQRIGILNPLEYFLPETPPETFGEAGEQIAEAVVESEVSRRPQGIVVLAPGPRGGTTTPQARVAVGLGRAASSKIERYVHGVAHPIYGGESQSGKLGTYVTPLLAWVAARYGAKVPVIGRAAVGIPTAMALPALWTELAASKRALEIARAASIPAKEKGELIKEIKLDTAKRVAPYLIAAGVPLAGRLGAAIPAALTVPAVVEAMSTGRRMTKAVRESSLPPDAKNDLVRQIRWNTVKQIAPHLAVAGLPLALKLGPAALRYLRTLRR